MTPKRTIRVTGVNTFWDYRPRETQLSWSPLAAGEELAVEMWETDFVFDDYKGIAGWGRLESWVAKLIARGPSINGTAQYRW